MNQMIIITYVLSLCVDAKMNLQTQRANNRSDIQSMLVDLTC